LGEALAQYADASPMAIIHSSYYAMFHASRAVLFQVTGEAPKTHDQTIQQFGLLVRDLDDALRAAGKAFNEVKDERKRSRLRGDHHSGARRSTRRFGGGGRFP
jgi:uncharacterized protein (UPF0332 family)